MKKVKLTLIFLYVFINIGFSNDLQDSLVKYSDLKYHSDFERSAVRNYVKEKKDTLNLFLAIDPNMTDDVAKRRNGTFLSIFDDMAQKKIVDKKINKQIRLIYANVHDRFLRKYNDNEYFPEIFQTGIYNCVTASMLYAMVFDKFKIPYKVEASSNHVYLIANPGAKSVVVETTNPNFENAIFSGEFKSQYVNYLKSSKLISETEYKSKSVEEIFEEKFKEVKDATFDNLAGFQYYNKALTKFRNNEYEDAFALCEKAYFFFPDNQVKTLLNTTLLFLIERCKFDQVSDIDYLAILSRFENTDPQVVVGIFKNIIYHHLQYTNMESFCDSMNQRLVSQLSDKNLIDEINFAYNLQMSYRYQNSDKIEKYVVKALNIKGNYHDAQVMLTNYLERKLYGISSSNVLLDTISQMESRYNKLEVISTILKEHKMRAYLQLANDSFAKKKITAGNNYLHQFEENCDGPIKNQMLSNIAANAYHTVAVYYFYKGFKTKAKSYIIRGLKYVPHNRLLESAIY